LGFGATCGDDEPGRLVGVTLDRRRRAGRRECNHLEPAVGSAAPMDMVDFEDFHRQEVPRFLAAGRGVAAARDLGRGKALAFRLATGPAYTYRSTGIDLEIAPGDDAPTVVELAPDAFADLASETWSVFGLLYADRVATPRGTFAELARWEAPLQALWFGRPIYGPDAMASLVDRGGKALDLSQSFSLDQMEDAANFLSVAGFVILRQVFDAAEIDELNAVVADERAKAAPGDGQSWWATRADGREVCCRLTYMAKRSPNVARLAEDDRLQGIAALADAGVVPCLDRLDGVSVVIKNADVVAGLSDLPWHRDCGIGGHRILCPGLNVGIQLDRADAANGQLQYLAGSHQHAAQQVAATELDGLPVVGVETEPGDVTVHFGHTLHAAPPPTSSTAGRKALYFGYHVPEVFKVIGPGQSYNDVLVRRDAGRVKSVDEIWVT
jgi:ectoine hydroxylase-related dioxygenase (phytanoyl-CoA dioxygenase family)